MTSKARIRLKVGVVGLGRLGKVYVRDLAGRIPETAVVAVADSDRALADRIADQFDVPKAYGSAQDLIADRNVEAVVVGIKALRIALAATAACRTGQSVNVDSIQ